jgi:formylglycine-generating enzyme required for sulfatase activity
MRREYLKPWLGFIIAGCCMLEMSTHVYAAGLAASAKAGKMFRDCPSCPRMVVIPAGSFAMGSADSEEGRGDDEGPVHRVNVPGFAMGKTEITRGEFSAFVKKYKYSAGDKCWTLEEGKVEERAGDWRSLHYEQTDNYPIGCINWNDAQAYAKWLSRKTGKMYRLPTEAEWEYAARGNTSTSRYWGDNPDQACVYANGADKTAQAGIKGASSWGIHNCTDGFDYTAPAGSFKPNAFGLNDMLGNVWEWTEDSYKDSYKDVPTDGSAYVSDKDKRVLRGGSWNNAPRNMRSAVRNGYKSDLRYSFFGFRLARKLP